MQYYLHLLSGKALCELELPNEGHVLLHIDIPNHQVYPLPLLITPFPCVYLISFDLDEEDKALKSIDDILKDMYAYSEQQKVRPVVFLVGLQTEEKERISFTKRLQDMLRTRSYDKLIVPPGGGDLHWTSRGANLYDDVALLCGIQGNSCRPPTQLTYQSLARHCELHHRLKNGERLVLYKDIEAEMARTVQDPIETHNFEDILKNLHSFGLIFYHPLNGLETVVVRQLQHLYEIFAQVQQLSKDWPKATIGNFMQTKEKKGIDTMEKEEWFKKLCSKVGLVIEECKDKNKDYVFVMGLDHDYEVPERAHFSVDPLLVTYRLPALEQKADDCLLPTPFFPTFVNAFLKKLNERNPKQRRPIHVKRHYLHVSFRRAVHIHVIKREQFIEIGLQQFHLGANPTNAEMVVVLQKACQDVRCIVSESIHEIANLSSSDILLGFLCNCECFGEFDQDDYTVTCSNCNAPADPTLQQQIWFKNIDEKV